MNDSDHTPTRDDQPHHTAQHDPSPSLDALERCLSEKPPRFTSDHAQAAARRAFVQAPPVPWWTLVSERLRSRWVMAPASLVLAAFAVWMILPASLPSAPDTSQERSPVALQPLPDHPDAQDDEGLSDDFPSPGAVLVAHAERSVALRGGHTLRVNQGQVSVIRQSEQETSLLVEQGQVHLEVQPLSENQRMDVRTPLVKVSVVGTAFTVDHHQGRTTVRVDHGRVRVESLLKAGEVHLVDAGDELQIDEHGVVLPEPPSAEVPSQRTVSSITPPKPATSPKQAPASPSSESLLSEARRALRENRLDEAETHLLALVDHTPQGNHAAQALYLLGETNLAMNKRGPALRHFVAACDQASLSPALREAATHQLVRLLETSAQTLPELSPSLRDHACSLLSTSRSKNEASQALCRVCGW